MLRTEEIFLYSEKNKSYEVTMKTFFSLLAFSLTTTAVAGCLTVNYPAGNYPLCTGDRVYLINDGGDVRIGTAAAIYQSGKVKVKYSYSGTSYELFRQVSDVYPSVECLGDLCAGDSVQLINDGGDKRDGSILEGFANGLFRVEYTYSGTYYNLYRSGRDLLKHQSRSGKFSIGNSVYLINDGGDARVGTILMLTDREAKVSYTYSGTSYSLYRSLDDISLETQCVHAVCRGYKVLIMNDGGDYREAIVKRAFENGMLQVSYRYSGTEYTLWRRTSDCSPVDEEI